MKLEEIAQKHGSNKALSYFEWCNFYDFHTKHIHNKINQAVLEIGHLKEKASGCGKNFSKCEDSIGSI